MTDDRHLMPEEELLHQRLNLVVAHGRRHFAGRFREGFGAPRFGDGYFDG
jgi:hypothetical protein